MASTSVVFEDAVLCGAMLGTDETLCGCEPEVMPVDCAVCNVVISVGCLVNAVGRTDEFIVPEGVFND